MTPAPTHVPARALDDARLRWALSGVVVLVLAVARGELWSLVLNEVPGTVPLALRTVPGVAMVLGWLVSGVLVLAVALWVSPLGGDDVRRSIGWWAALVVLDAIWRLVLVPMDLLWVVPYLGPAVGALAVCALLAARRTPLRSYLGSAVAASLVLALLTWTGGTPAFSIFFASRHRMLVESVFNAAVLLAVVAGCLVGVGIGRVRRVRVA